MRLEPSVSSLGWGTLTGKYCQQHCANVPGTVIMPHTRVLALQKTTQGGKNGVSGLGVVVRICNPSIWELRLARVTQKDLASKQKENSQSGSWLVMSQHF